MTTNQKNLWLTALQLSSEECIASGMRATSGHSVTQPLVNKPTGGILVSPLWPFFPFKIFGKQHLHFITVLKFCEEMGFAHKVFKWSKNS